MVLILEKLQLHSAGLINYDNLSFSMNQKLKTMLGFRQKTCLNFPESMLFTLFARLFGLGLTFLGDGNYVALIRMEHEEGQKEYSKSRYIVR